MHKTIIVALNIKIPILELEKTFKEAYYIVLCYL